MNMTTFLEQVMCGLNNSIGDRYKIENVNKTKNNDIFLTGVSIREKSNPTGQVFYLDEFFTEYQNGNLRISDIVEIILKRSKEEGVPDGGKLGEMLGNYNQIKETIRVKLINYDANKEMLLQQPFVPYLDLAVVFIAILGDAPNGVMTIQITNHMMELWGIDKPELYQQALSNTVQYEPASIESMNHFMSRTAEEMGGQDEVMKLLTEMIMLEKPQLYIASNLHHHFGAAALLDHGFLQKFAKEQDSDLLIYPSSIDEILLQLLKSMPPSAVVEVKEVNDGVVEKELQLSNSVYLFERETNAVSIYKVGSPLNE